MRKNEMQDDSTNEEKANLLFPKAPVRDQVRKVNPDEPFAAMEVPLTLRNPESYKRFSLYQLIYSLAGLLLGLTCILGGLVLFLHGVTGSTSWTANILGAKSKLSDATPGVVLFIVGMFVVYITRFSVKIKK